MEVFQKIILSKILLCTLLVTEIPKDLIGITLVN